MPITWEALAAEPLEHTPFLIDPYLPRGGVVLLHGKYSTGKSPLTWEIAACVGEGRPFFGHDVTPGRVLYIELDTPRPLVRQRLAVLTPAPNVWWAFLPPVPGTDRLLEEGRAVSPDLVIINTLRKTYMGPDKESQVPFMVYGKFQRAFPGACLLFVHHDRKAHLEDDRPDDEGFAGSMAWVNDAQVALHVTKSGKAFRLTHTKSQVSEFAAPLTYTIQKDGTIGTTAGPQLAEIWAALSPDLPLMERYRLAASKLGITEQWVRKLLAKK